MKTIYLALLATSALLAGGCQAPQKNALGAKPALVGEPHVVGYDDQRIAGIRRGETTEPQLLDWFGPPESREVQPNGRSTLAWSFGRRTEARRRPSGVLNVSLSPEGKVDAYSARRGPE